MWVSASAQSSELHFVKTTQPSLTGTPAAIRRWQFAMVEWSGAIIARVVLIRIPSNTPAPLPLPPPRPAPFTSSTTSISSSSTANRELSQRPRFLSSWGVIQGRAARWCSVASTSACTSVAYRTFRSTASFIGRSRCTRL